MQAHYQSTKFLRRGRSCDFSKLLLEERLEEGTAVQGFALLGRWDFPCRTPLSGSQPPQRKRRISTVMLSGPPR